VHVENENSAAVETCQPELAPIVSKSAVVSFITTIDGNAADNFSVRRRPRFYIDGDKFICAVTHSFDAERPHINELFLTVDAGEIWGRARFIRAGCSHAQTKVEREQKGRSKNAGHNQRSAGASQGESFHSMTFLG
jgi:hypothetical protein